MVASLAVANPARPYGLGDFPAVFVVASRDKYRCDVHRHVGETSVDTGHDLRGLELHRAVNLRESQFTDLTVEFRLDQLHVVEFEPLLVLLLPLGYIRFYPGADEEIVRFYLDNLLCCCVREPGEHIEHIFAQRAEFLCHCIDSHLLQSSA